MRCAVKDQLLKGTMILTIAGFATRVIGFCYRIFLAGELGEVNLGIYQLIFRSIRFVLQFMPLASRQQYHS